MVCYSVVRGRTAVVFGGTQERSDLSVGEAAVESRRLRFVLSVGHRLAVLRVGQGFVSLRPNLFGYGDLRRAGGVAGCLPGVDRPLCLVSCDRGGVLAKA